MPTWQPSASRVLGQETEIQGHPTWAPGPYPAAPVASVSGLQLSPYLFPGFLGVFVSTSLHLGLCLCNSCLPLLLSLYLFVSIFSSLPLSASVSLSLLLTILFSAFVSPSYPMSVSASQALPPSLCLFRHFLSLSSFLSVSVSLSLSLLVLLPTRSQAQPLLHGTPLT